LFAALLPWLLVRLLHALMPTEVGLSFIPLRAGCACVTRCVGCPAALGVFG
jgi:hypothetical protein